MSKEQERKYRFTSKRLSVCIPTFNRCKSLAATLESLVAQTYRPSFGYEILIIDNNCSDETSHVINSFSDRLPLRHIVEHKQGVSHARNRAIAEFIGDVLLLVDDDVTLARDWLSKYATAFKQYPEADIFGGRILTAFVGSKPRWLIDCNLPLLSGVLVNLDHGEDVRIFGPGEVGPWSANLAVRRRVFQKIGGLRVDLGPTGLAHGRGDETEFIDRAIKVGAQRVYVGDALGWHWIGPDRLTWLALYRHGLEKGRAQFLVYGGRPKRALAQALTFGLRGAGQLVKGRGDRARQCIINAGMLVGHRYYSREAESKAKHRSEDIQPGKCEG